MGKKIGVVILNYLTYELTKKCLDNLRLLDYDNYFVVVVDNNSPNNSSIELEQYCNQLKDEGFLDVFFIKAMKNGGYSSGNNIGIKYAEENGADYVIIMNNDIEIENFNILNDMSKRFIDNPNLAVLGPTIVTNGQVDPPLAEQPPNIIKTIAKNILLPIYLKMGEFKRKNQSEQLREKRVYAVSGCFFIADLKKFKEVDYFDENVFLYGEELILGEKFSQKGYEVFFTTELKINHLHSETINTVYNKKKREKMLDESIKYYYMNYRNEISTFKKWVLKISWKIKETVYFRF